MVSSLICISINSRQWKTPPREPKRLIPCPACNQEISNYANNCPSCGQPVRTPEPTEKSRKRGFIVGTGVDIDNDGNPWVSTYFDGLWKYDIKTNLYSQFVTNKTNPTSIPAALKSIKIDNQNNIWIGSKGEGAFKQA